MKAAGPRALEVGPMCSSDTLTAPLESSTPQDESEPADRLLIVARELTRGGAAYLALRYARRLCERYAIDVLVTGPADDEFLEELPAGVTIFPLGEGPSRHEGSALRCLHQFIKRHQETPVFQRSYRAVLATSIFPDWRACALATTVRADRRLICLVDECLVCYHGLGPPERGILERCRVLAADVMLPVSHRLWQAA